MSRILDNIIIVLITVGMFITIRTLMASTHWVRSVTEVR